MKNFVFDGEEGTEKKVEEEADTTEEEGFMEGFEEEEEAMECAECGTKVSPEKKVTRNVESEEYVFCSEECAKEFEESLGEVEE
ncbi:MAG: hypothetical protein AABY26_02900 [Nanoarchaeota archaeon]